MSDTLRASRADEAFALTPAPLPPAPRARSDADSLGPAKPPTRGVAHLLADLALGPDAPLAIRAYDGSVAGAPDPVATIVVVRPDALWRLVTAPGELGAGRAYVAGDLDLEGDLPAGLHWFAEHRPRAEPAAVLALARAARATGLRPLPPPPEEVHLRGRRHSKGRDQAAVSHHYDVSNDFYRLVLGPSLTYSCAVWETPGVGLDAAQEAKHELICRKLGLRSGMRLLDVGCGWGSLALHAAQRHGARVVGVTISQQQADLARQRVREAGLDGRVEIRLQDYRDVRDGPFDAISSVGMFEHVGRARLAEYFATLHSLLRPAGRLLNHGIDRPAQPADAWPVPRPRAPWRKRTFIDRFVFPDGELHELGSVISQLQHHGLEVRHVESLREHYALTLRAWLANLEASWDEAVALSTPGRARVWRLYMAAATMNFAAGGVTLHQVLAVKPDGGRSGLPLRPTF